MITLHFWGKPLKVKTFLRTIYLKVPLLGHFFGTLFGTLYLKVKTSLRKINLKVLYCFCWQYYSPPLIFLWHFIGHFLDLFEKDKFEGYCPFFLLPAGLFSSVNLRYDPITFYIWRICSTSKIDDDNTHFCFRKPIFRCVPSLSWDMTPLHLIFEGSVPPPP